MAKRFTAAQMEESVIAELDRYAKAMRWSRSEAMRSIIEGFLLRISSDEENVRRERESV